MGKREWSPPIELRPREKRIYDRAKNKKLFQFLRRQRHSLFDAEFREQLWGMYSAKERGKDRVDPALLSVVTLLQAACGVSDRDAVELALDSRRWQMVLDHWDEDKAPFSQGTLFNFRERLIANDMDRVLLERTVRLAHELGGFSYKHLKVAFDASPLFGAGRVEDTFNLIGRAAWRVVKTAAETLRRPPEEVAEEAGITVLTHSSVKRGLDRDWTVPGARSEAITELLAQVRSLESWLRQELELDQPPLKEEWDLVEALIEQDTEPDPDGPGHRIRRGVAKDRKVSVGDPDMRHGRKSKSSRFDGYKRHVAVNLDSTAICAVAVTRGNAPEREASGDLLEDLDRLPGTVTELFTDRGYLGAEPIEERRKQGQVIHLCKPFPLRNRGRYTRADFKVDMSEGTMTCPNGVTRPCRLGKPTRFPASACDACPHRANCTTARPGRGRSVSLHAEEPFLIECRQRLDTAEGRDILRRRVASEHALAAVERTQTKRSRYKGLRKVLFDVRRHSAVQNLFLAARLERAA